MVQVLYKTTREKLDVKQLMDGGGVSKDGRVPASVLNQLIQLRKVALGSVLWIALNLCPVDCNIPWMGVRA